MGHIKHKTHSIIQDVHANPINYVMPTSETDSTELNLYHPSMSSVEMDNDAMLDNSSSITLNVMTSSRSPETERNLDLTFTSKGLHFSNLNIRHLVPKLDELRLHLAADNGPDIMGICETFLECSVPDCQLNIQGFNFMCKDRSEILNKTGGGLVLYYKDSINCNRRSEFEVSKIETLWSEFTLPNSRSFLVCTVYRPPRALSEWVSQFEHELSIAQTTGLEIILMGDFNIDYISQCINTKWLNMIQLFDLSQLVSKPTRVTETSATLIDHVYTNHPENVTECFVSHVSISDHFPVCFTRKVNCKLS